MKRKQAKKYRKERHQIGEFTSSDEEEEDEEDDEEEVKKPVPAKKSKASKQKHMPSSSSQGQASSSSQGGFNSPLPSQLDAEIQEGPDVPASAEKAADGDSEENVEEAINEHAGPSGPRWTKFEDGAAIMQVDVESKEPDYSYTCKYISIYIHNIYTLFTRYLHT